MEMLFGIALGFFLNELCGWLDEQLNTEGHDGAEL